MLKYPTRKAQESQTFNRLSTLFIFWHEQYTIPEVICAVDPATGWVSLHCDCEGVASESEFHTTNYNYKTTTKRHKKKLSSGSQVISLTFLKKDVS